jgi:hypothetical protein
MESLKSRDPSLMKVGYKNLVISSTPMLFIWMMVGNAGGIAFLLHLATVGLFYIISYRLVKRNAATGFCVMLLILQLLMHLLTPSIADSLHSYTLPNHVKHGLANNISWFFGMMFVFPEFGVIFWGLLGALVLHGKLQANMRRKQDAVWQSFGFRVRDRWEYYDPFYPHIQIDDWAHLSRIASEQPQLAKFIRYSGVKRALFVAVWLLLVVVMGIFLMLMLVIGWA